MPERERDDTDYKMLIRASAEAKYKINRRGYFETGKKLCVRCRIWYGKTSLRFCDDCHRQLRTKPRGSVGRRRLQLSNPPVRY
ncbi:MAG: hypothetical protein GEU26_18500 [Nitrososphaeraceae archaeon]|nr:hypothetical protein [Nitrososphaeraceae archaeon]